MCFDSRGNSRGLRPQTISTTKLLRLHIPRPKAEIEAEGRGERSDHCPARGRGRSPLRIEIVTIKGYIMAEGHYCSTIFGTKGPKGNQRTCKHIWPSAIYKVANKSCKGRTSRPVKRPQTFTRAKMRSILPGKSKRTIPNRPTRWAYNVYSLYRWPKAIYTLGPLMSPLRGSDILLSFGTEGPKR